MEYKYQMLMPFSTQSIDFKLSETHIGSNTFLSPCKGKESLTYTVSVESIPDLLTAYDNYFKGES